LKTLAASAVERNEGAIGRAVIEPEEAHDVRRGERVTEAVEAPHETHLGNVRTEPIPDVGFVTPQQGGRHSRRSDEAGDRLEHAADEAGRSPVGHGDGTAGHADPRQFGGSEVRPGSEHGAVDAGHDIEVGFGEGESFGVGGLEAGIEVFGGGADARPLDEVFGDVDAGGTGALAGGNQRELA
jgi:hypothetical protein